MGNPFKDELNIQSDWTNYSVQVINMMGQVVYTKPKIEAELSANYYAVKFNVESEDTIQFGGKKFLNLNVGKKRVAYHQIAELLAGQDEQELSLPAVVFLDEAFTIEKRLFRYISPKELLVLLQE